MSVKGAAAQGAVRAARTEAAAAAGVVRAAAGAAQAALAALAVEMAAEAGRAPEDLSDMAVAVETDPVSADLAAAVAAAAEQG